MTECTEVSYIVPSYFFLRCRKSSEGMEMLYNFRNEEKHSIIIEHASFLRPFYILAFLINSLFLYHSAYPLYT